MDQTFQLISYGLQVVNRFCILVAFAMANMQQCQMRTEGREETA